MSTPDAVPMEVKKEDKYNVDMSKQPTTCIIVGMAGSGKSTLMRRIFSHLNEKASSDLSTPSSTTPYLINIDPAVTGELAFPCNIDIRDTVDYKQIMHQHGLGPNGAILTSLNLFVTKFNDVLDIIVKKQLSAKQCVFVDTPGQIEAFTWSASGQIVCDALALHTPTVLLYVVDTHKAASPATFMSNMLYACSMMVKTQLPFILVFNKIDVRRHEFAATWLKDFDEFQNAITDEGSYMGSLTRSMNLVLEEFYNSAHFVGVSAFTGEGIDTLMKQVQTTARNEFIQTHIQKQQHQQQQHERKQQHQQEKQDRQLKRLREDMATTTTTTTTPKLKTKMVEVEDIPE